MEYAENQPGPRCEHCGTPLDAGIKTGGLCPRCLLEMNFASRTMPGGEPSPQVPPPSPEEMAARFPQFEILECLGRGGMGIVYKARQKTLDRLVAIKVLAGERNDDPQFEVRFSREARTLAKLSHPNIVTVHDFGESDGMFYLVMEFVDGVNLRDVLRDGRMEPEQALAIVPEICAALQFAHVHGVVHRDIKPENILMDRDGRVKIADFGIASLIGVDADHSGTPPYMAPEQQAAGGTIDHRADIYALGVVFYEMLTGERPEQDPSKPSGRVEIDVRLDEIVLRALEKEPARRYQTAGEFRTVVETIVGKPPGVKSTGKPRFSRLAIWGAVWASCIFVFSFIKLLVSGSADQHAVSSFLSAFVEVPLVMFGFTAPFGTTVLGWVSVSQIRGSAGRLCGMGLALFDALLFPLLGLNAGIWLIVGNLWRANPPEVSHPVGAFLARNEFIVPLLAVALCAVLDLTIVRRVWQAANKSHDGESHSQHVHNGSSGIQDSSATSPGSSPRFERVQRILVLRAVVMCAVSTLFASHLHPANLQIALVAWGFTGLLLVSWKALVSSKNRENGLAALNTAHQIGLIHTIGVLVFGALLAFMNQGLNRTTNMLLAGLLIGAILINLLKLYKGFRADTYVLSEHRRKQWISFMIAISAGLIAAAGLFQWRSNRTETAPTLTQNSTVTIEPDGLVRGAVTVGYKNRTDKTVRKSRSVNSDYIHIDFIRDERGRPIQFQARPGEGDTIEYELTFNDPVPPGGTISFTCEGIQTGAIKSTNEHNVFEYSMKHWPAYDGPTHRIEHHILPSGAELIDKFPDDLKEGETGGHIELLLDRMIQRGGHIEVRYRYRLPEPVAAKQSSSSDAVTARVTVEDHALRFLVAIREKDEETLRALCIDRNKGWTEAMAGHFAMELRERFRQLTGEDFTLYPDPTGVGIDKDLAVVACRAVRDVQMKLNGNILILYFCRTESGWKVWTVRYAPESKPIEEHLEQARKWAAEWNAGSAGTKANPSEDLGIMKEYATALALYQVNVGSLPPNLEILVAKKILSELKLMENHATGNREQPLYHGSPVLQAEDFDNSKFILLAAPTAGPDGRHVVGFLDASVKVIDESRYQAQLAWQRKPPLERTTDAFLETCAENGISDNGQMFAALGMAEFIEQYGDGQSAMRKHHDKLAPVMRWAIDKRTGDPSPDCIDYLRGVHRAGDPRLAPQARLLLKLLGVEEHHPAGAPAEDLPQGRLPRQ